MSYLLGNYKLEVLRSITDVAPSEWDACLPRTSEQPRHPIHPTFFYESLGNFSLSYGRNGLVAVSPYSKDLNKDLIAACPLYLKITVKVSMYLIKIGHMRLNVRAVVIIQSYNVQFLSHP